ncbi:DUF6417 family protein [Streptomyces prunicolor]|uniref:DUF6417 family protein n=1 Tax=Streptomyces prunicolor TaxID=67348 RepID=UPI00372425FC
MRSGEKRIAVLEELDERQRAAEHHWVVDEEEHVPFRRGVEAVVGEGLAELADRETCAELSAYAARPVHWAARLTGHGRDVLVFARGRALTEPEVCSPAPGEQVVELRPAQMVALRVFVALADELATPPAEGLAEQVRGARFTPTDKRWRLHLTQEQIASAAYGLYLHRLGGSAAEANRFGREYGAIYRSPPTAGEPTLIRVPAVLQPGQMEGEHG